MYNVHPDMLDIFHGKIGLEKSLCIMKMSFSNFLWQSISILMKRKYAAENGCGRRLFVINKATQYLSCLSNQ